MSKNALAFGLLETLIKPKRKFYKQEYQQQGCKDGAVFVELGDIADLHCFGLGGFYLDGVGLGYFSITPTGMPLFQVNRVRSDSNKDAVMEIDTVALELGGGVVTCCCCGKCMGLGTAGGQ